MSELTNKADVAGLTAGYDAIAASVTFADGVPAVDKSGLEGALAKKVTLASLQECVKSLESKFSGNCNCLVNTDCCQSCQTTTCQSTYCQSQYCQSCQSSACQSCQRSGIFNCGQCDCSSH